MDSEHNNFLICNLKSSSSAAAAVWYYFIFVIKDHMEECSCKTTVFAQRELTELRVIGMTSIDPMVYSFIALPQSETILSLKSVSIDMGCNNFCSSNVQVIILTGLD